MRLSSCLVVSGLLCGLLTTTVSAQQRASDRGLDSYVPAAVHAWLATERMVTALPQSEGSRAGAHSHAVPACRPDGAEPASPEFAWRWRAFERLDCVISIVERRLASTDAAWHDGTRDTVAMPREELEGIRTLAWWARDAAARIGR